MDLRPTFLQSLEADWITEAYDVRAYIADTITR
jgi:hypothetical protein